MVRQAYVNRLVLGRSAFDPPSAATESTSATEQGEGYSSEHAEITTANDDGTQRYNARGYPENSTSRQLARRNRHAQNDILTTIGVCVCIDEQGEIKTDASFSVPKTAAEKRQARVMLDEHRYGSLIGSITVVTAEAASSWIVFLRRRIQVFQRYSGMPLQEIIYWDWARTSTFNFFVASFISDVFYHGVKVLVEGMYETAVEPATLRLRKFTARLPPSFRRFEAIKTTLWCLSAQTMQALCDSLLDMIMILQQLQILPSWPPISKYALITVIHLLPPAPTSLRAASILPFTQAVLMSPLALSLSYRFATGLARERLFSYLRTLLLRPDNPDSGSYLLELDGEQIDPADAPSLLLPPFQRTLREQLAIDRRNIKRSFSLTLSKLLKTFHTWKILLPWGGMRTGPDYAVQSVSFAAEDSFPSQQIEPEPEPEALTGPSESAPEPLAGPSESEPPPGSGTQEISPPRSPGSTTSDVLSEIDPSAVQVRTRSGSTSTMRMDLEVQLPMSHQQLREQRRNSFTQNESELNRSEHLHDVSSPEHRVTQLTIHSSTTLSMQLSILLTSALLLPLESIYLRALARSFIGTRGASSSRLDRTIYPPFEYGLQRYGWKGIVLRGTQLLLCLGLETGVRLYFWRICGTASLWWGRNKFGWGRL